MTTNKKTLLKIRRKARIRSKVSGVSDRPRLAVFRSNDNIYAQVIDDTKGTTIAAADDRKIKKVSQKDMSTKMAKAYEVGQLVANMAKEKKITTVVFDRGGYKYHGRVRALADGARAAGLKF